MSCLTAGLPQGWVYIWYAVAFALLTTLLSPRSMAAWLGECRGTVLSFAAFFLLLAALPIVAGITGAPAVQKQLSSWGVTVGQAWLGLRIVVLSLPFIALTLAGSARNAGVAAMYPLARGGLTSPARFVAYEAAYVLFYYTAWEFCFRGVLFLPLVSALGLLPALGIQTALSTVYHIGHPKAEIWISVLGGLFFGVVVHLTGSVLYSIIMHAAIGVGVDYIQWRRQRALTA